MLVAVAFHDADQDRPDLAGALAVDFVDRPRELEVDAGAENLASGDGTAVAFEDGFLAGVKQYNEDNGKNVEVLGWDGSNGQFVGNFEDSDKGKSITQTFLDDGADIVMPVAGPVGAGTIAAVKDAGGDASIIWVDTDGCVSVADSCQYFLTSVQKKMDTAVYDTIKATEEGSFDNTAYVGTLENKGVDIAPYHDHEADVPEELTAKIEEYRQKIISGDYKIGG